MGHIQETPLSSKELVQNAEAWLRQARRDSAAVGRLLGQYQRGTRPHLSRNPEVAVYLLQQSVEKAAKALMIASGEDEGTLRRPPSVTIA